MKKFSSCDTIKIENSRAICPACGNKLPGFYHPGYHVNGLSVRCKKCRQIIEINVRDQRPTESSVQ